MGTGRRPMERGLGGFAEFLRPTASAVAKLLAAWDTLHPETQIRLLHELPSVDLPPHLAKRICLKALDSPTPYVRYLASTKFYSRIEHAADRTVINAKIEADADPLVRHSLLEATPQSGLCPGSLEDPEQFFSLPQDARLAIVRSHAGVGRQIARLAEYALKRADVSDIDLLEILSDYVSNPYFQESYRPHTRPLQHDNQAEFELGQELQALWRLVPVLPRSAAKLLIRSLPERVGLSFGIPQEVLDKLSDEQIVALFSRRDIELKALRKDIALGHADRAKPLRLSAMSHNFDLSYEEFSRLIFDPEHVRSSEMSLAPLDAKDKKKSKRCRN